MAFASSCGVSRLRSAVVDRSAREVNRSSIEATAFSNSEKLDVMSEEWKAFSERCVSVRSRIRVNE